MNNFRELSLIDLTESDESDIEMAGDQNQNQNEAINEQQNTDQGTLIQRVAVKVPPFWGESPDIWFVQVEAQFATANVVTDDSKFNTVVGAIESQVLNKVRNAVLNPPTGRKYDNLKEAMLKEFAESDYAKMKKLFSDLSLGDNKPSFLLNDMRRLGGTNVNDDVLKTLWIQQLPVQIRAIIATSTSTLTELATTADKIHEVSSLSSVQQVTNDTSQPSANEMLSTIQKQINQLCNAFKSFNNDGSRARSRSRRDHFQRNRSQTPSTSDQTEKKSDDFCWYHRTMGNKANKCRSPCRFRKSKN